MHNLFERLTIVLLVLLMGGTANADSFSSLKDFIEYKPNGTVQNEYIEITNTFSYTHLLDGTGGMTPEFSLTSSLFLLDDATLSVRHKDNANSDDAKEVWFSRSDTNIFIGQLSTSSADWLLDSWTLSNAILDLMQTPDPWSLTINLYDSNTGSNDKLKIDFSLLEGNYHDVDNTGTTGETDGNTNTGGVTGSSVAPVPEPATMFLFGTGLVGLAGIARNRRKKQI